MLTINATGDLARTLGSFVQIKETTAQASVIAQRIQIRLSRWRGEWSYDTRLGMPWDELLQKGVTDTQLRARISAEILKVPGVTSLPEMAIVRNGRSVSVSCRAVIQSGQTIEFSTDIKI